MGYLVDSDVFMQAKNLHYGFDICPAFWEWLIAQNARGKVFSIEKVAKEIQVGTDELSTWAGERDDTFFLKPDGAVLPALANVSRWVTSQKYDPAAINSFLQVADYYLVAHAMAHKHVVVTHEKSAPLAKKVKIPNVCGGLGVKCITPFEMLRAERARFVLGPGPGRPKGAH
jgi:hypothetical protein